MDEEHDEQDAGAVLLALASKLSAGDITEAEYDAVCADLLGEPPSKDGAEDDDAEPAAQKAWSFAE